MKRPTIAFSTDVLVVAEVVRVLGKVGDDGRPYLRAANGSHAGRFVEHSWADATDWPGQPLSLELAPPDDWHADRFDPSPQLSATPAVRLRRLPFGRPELGIVIGTTWRKEGIVRPGYSENGKDREPAYLDGPHRQVTLHEIALPPAAGKARIVMAHTSDLTVMSLDRATPA